MKNKNNYSHDTDHVTINCDTDLIINKDDLSLNISDQTVGDQTNTTPEFGDANKDQNESINDTVSIMEGMVDAPSNLNIRENPSLDSNIIGELTPRTIIGIDINNSSNDFYNVIGFKIDNEIGEINGYCLKKYIVEKNDQNNNE